MSGKKVADVAVKASKNIDWEAMAKLLVSDEARKEFSTLRRTFDEVNSTLQTKFSQEPEPIDWEYYRKGIGSRLVDMYQEAYEIGGIEGSRGKILKESERVEKEISEVQEMKKKISTMTANEYFEKQPELKKKFDDEIRNEYWGY